MFNLFCRSYHGIQRGLRRATTDSSGSPTESSEINTPVAAAAARPPDRFVQNGQPNFLPIYDVTRYAELLPEFNSSLFSDASEGVERAFMLRYTQKLVSLVHSAKTSDEQLANNPFECRFAVTKAEVAGNPRVPPFHSDAAFVLKMTQRCCFSVATVVAGLDYFIRLIDKGLVHLHHTSWRSLWVCCMLLAEKMWEDNFVHPVHIMGQYSSNAHTRSEYLRLQMGILKVLNWDMNITLKRFTDLVANIMAHPVSPEVLSAVPRHPGKLFILRPLPKVPKMNFNLSSRLRLKNTRLLSRHGGRLDVRHHLHAAAVSSDSSGGAASTVAESHRPDVYNEIKEVEDSMDITSFGQPRSRPAVGYWPSFAMMGTIIRSKRPTILSVSGEDSDDQMLLRKQVTITKKGQKGAFAWLSTRPWRNREDFERFVSKSSGIDIFKGWFITFMLVEHTRSSFHVGMDMTHWPVMHIFSKAACSLDMTCFSTAYGFMCYRSYLVNTKNRPLSTTLTRVFRSVGLVFLALIFMNITFSLSVADHMPAMREIIELITLSTVYWDFLAAFPLELLMGFLSTKPIIAFSM
ncbi:hypothetical protein Pmar_PMAR002274 [Perkinsus marinus ATCC 50983]|uniref:Cyclin N-terminal domain-containing protein n=1 Tax=Perkinsus marinus (strain ATCC 50983 / TXsc) TaxID=423536 RepID=C5KUV6_PERM5|nr:hypothetical protein Pmar_PMAR002274 [Perkinsus marinus ATCC 50983]EER11671.1 hypothetical protein Pmar_PMAR002274 [Perkinsus marinus ATCC 50983]|eukprot:XP_002779876.1 hypothetical protein Pmar_PMAR002274 [Perkinsus marinus ATCC 50983]